MTQSSPPDGPGRSDRTVSIIIPVFETTAALFSRCIESVLVQHHQALEVIVVDDGSSPDYAAWLRDFEHRDSRITVLRQQHLGVSAARNTGVERATGSFIGFVDSDDWVSPEYVSTAIDIAFRTGADAVFGGIRVTTESSSTLWRTGSSTAVNPRLLSGHALTSTRAGALAESPSPHRPTSLVTLTNVVAALFRSEVATTLRFPEGVSQGEDRVYLVDFLGAAHSVALCADVWYFYEHSIGSTTRSVALRSAEQLVATLGAFARLGGFSSDRVTRDIAAEIRDAAATGILNYLKLLSGVLAASVPHRIATPVLRRALETPGIAEALSHVHTHQIRDRVFTRFAKGRSATGLLLLGRVWVLTSPRAPKRNDNHALGSPAVEPMSAGTSAPESPPRADVGLIVHFSTSNYGNHLVNFAAANVLEQCGLTVELLHFNGREESSVGRGLARLPLKLRRLGFRGAIDRVLGRARRTLRRPTRSPQMEASARAREARFRAFSDEHLRPRTVPITARHALTAEYARFAIGSDQIWNYDYQLGPWNFADFAAAADVLPLSPSVGHATIPLEWRAFYAGQLARFSEVGTRELDWTAMVPTAPGNPVFSQLIDPTLALTRAAWAEIAAPHAHAASRLVVYTLGELTDVDESFVQATLAQHNLEELRLSARVGGPHWESNAADFLGAIDACAGVVTDSYHGAVFAFLFDKPLTLIPRAGLAGAMNSRIDTFTAACGLEDRVISRLTPAAALSHDYADGHARLEHLRGSFWEYLARHGYERLGAQQSR